MPQSPRYIIITPARNEASFIGKTIESVVTQTVRPIKWIIVSDGSTDATDDIVKSYSDRYSWIELVRMPERGERTFAGKVNAFNAGYQRVAKLDYEIIGNLDADISFDSDYLESLLQKFQANPKLGVGGTSYLEPNSQYNYRFSSTDFVPGACQLFRRQCFDDIGGYMPVKGGNIDSIAVLSARMKGWETRAFTDKTYTHCRESGTAQSNSVAARFHRGEKSYAMGSHPAWELLRASYQMTRRPFVIGGVALLAGYLWSMIRRVERPVSPNLIAFQRQEQLQRLRQLFGFGSAKLAS